MEPTEICILCKQTLLGGQTVKVQKGIDNLKRMSVIRNDDVHKLLQNKDSIEIHTKCRYTYIRRVKETEQKSSEEPRHDLRTFDLPFDFKTMCLFCGQTPDYKHPKRNPISYASTMKVKNNIIKVCQERNDEWGNIILARVNSVIDLVASEARYHKSCYAFFSKSGTNPPGTSNLTGNKNALSVTKSNAFDQLCGYLEDNDECQYDIKELVSIMKEYSLDDQSYYSEEYLKKKLKAHYGDAIYITSRSGKWIVCFRGTASRILNDNWYEECYKNDSDERMRIVEAAAIIIREDIYSLTCDCENYPNIDEIASGGYNEIPKSLKCFLQSVMKSKGKHSQSSDKKVVTVANSIIAAARPRSYISPLQIGLGIYLHRKFASRSLVDMLSNIGISVSYKEVLKYETSLTQNNLLKIDPNAFLQFVFDNADHNVRTIDGHGTFHAMGGIECVTPADCVHTDFLVPRPKNLPKADSIGQYGNMKIKSYNRRQNCGLGKLIFSDVSQIKLEPDTAKIAHFMNMLWMSGPSCLNISIPSWSGFMEISKKNQPQEYQRSAICPLPFANLSPTNPSTIYTCLQYAIEECKKQGQNTCIVTFDQPLFNKALDIVLAADSGSPLSSVIVRLGGFHLVMSYMGAIGYLMEGSGIEELWEQVYATNTIGSLLSGHSFARAFRAHVLTLLVLVTVLFEKLINENSFSSEEMDKFKIHYESFLNETSDESNVHEFYNYIASVALLLESILLTEASKSRTAALWCQYIEMVQIMLMYVRAERMGDWQLHLYSVQCMLPILHAAGRNHYAKSAHAYLQLMLELETRMTKEDYDKFVGNGYFTIRRTSKFWSGIWSDMIIEQVLMRSMKVEGGLTHGRGLTESSISRWVNTIPVTIHVISAVEKLTGISSVYSNQHVELRESRKNRDTSDSKKFLLWLKKHSPFECPSDTLISISTGIKADKTVNCECAKVIGQASLNKFTGKTFDKAKFSRKDKVKNMATMTKTIKIGNQEVNINSNQLFHRIVCTVKTDEELKLCLKYELAPRPTSLFDTISLRKGKKSTLMDILEECCPSTEKLPEEPCFVIDGGYLLHKVIWPKPASFSQICDGYLDYLKRHYGINCIIIFDGYSESTYSTKYAEHLRRSGKGKKSVDIALSDVIFPSTTQSEFFRNISNKINFISLLSEKLAAADFKVQIAPGDADTYIVNAALKLSDNSKKGIIVGEDTDLLVIMIALANLNNECFMLMPASKDKPQRVFSSQQLQRALGDVANHILFLHAVTGCDTTSSLFKKGKKQAFRLLQSNEELREKVVVFNDKDASHEDIAQAGEYFLTTLYNGRVSSDKLNETRYKCYKKIVAKQPIYGKFDLSVIPPTSGAALQHSFRVFHQVQSWRGVSLPATDWGWKQEGSHLSPIPTLDPPAPENLLKLVFCNCKVNCNQTCECRRGGGPGVYLYVW